MVLTGLSITTGPRAKHVTQAWTVISSLRTVIGPRIDHMIQIEPIRVLSWNLYICAKGGASYESRHLKAIFSVTRA